MKRNTVYEEEEEEREMLMYRLRWRLDWDCTNNAKPEYAELAPIAMICMQGIVRPANHAKPEMFMFENKPRNVVLPVQPMMRNLTCIRPRP